MSTPMADAAGRALGELADADPDAVLVTGREPGMGRGFVDWAPGRWVVAPGPTTRLSVAAGITMVGRTVVAECGEPADARYAPWDACGSLIALTSSIEVATAAWEAGVSVLTPGWPADVAPMLLAAVGSGPLCLYLHGHEVPDGPPLALDPPLPHADRFVTHGQGDRVAASGHLVVPLLEAAWYLARRGRPITTIQLLCLRPGGPSPAEAAERVFVDDGGTWTPLSTDSTDPRAVEQAVVARQRR
jgi:hypothetical protein